MPWTKADVDSHVKGLTDAQKAAWVKIANEALAACLKKGGSTKTCEGRAIGIANAGAKKVKKAGIRDQGPGVGEDATANASGTPTPDPRPLAFELAMPDLEGASVEALHDLANRLRQQVAKCTSQLDERLAAIGEPPQGGGQLFQKSFPNEHVCWLRHPNEMAADSLERISAKALDAKDPHVFRREAGVLKGRLVETDEEATLAICYPGRLWTRQEARDHAERQGDQVSFVPVNKGQAEPRRWLIKSAKPERFVMDVVYEPWTEDLDGEAMTPEAIRKAAHSWMAKGHRVNLEHRGISTDTLVLESYVLPVDAEIGGEFFFKGSWMLGGRIRNPQLWAAIQGGEISGWSMQGRAYVNEVS